jgi:hypothetical protein
MCLSTSKKIENQPQRENLDMQIISQTDNQREKDAQLRERDQGREPVRLIGRGSSAADGIEAARPDE